MRAGVCFHLLELLRRGSRDTQAPTWGLKEARGQEQSYVERNVGGTILKQNESPCRVGLEARREWNTGGSADLGSCTPPSIHLQSTFTRVLLRNPLAPGEIRKPGTFLSPISQMRSEGSEG